ncbi:hypothetical protein [Lysinibacillus sphaericus]|uniref:hypothetical protein n=1 Tax=Lysinibacillus sphaericus TaxID=1421 RepID=UPI0015D4F293|nr:hypothetical protein [Lysinibacillus sphaericus]QTB12368.1 hypothetical protein J2B92_16035 [Lysinibacillus sphaericus]QTB25780.1 hypothetical protein J2D51_15885 [Lysinibacillus sphaericus]
MKRDKKDTEFSTDEPTKQTFSTGAEPESTRGKGYTEPPHPDKEDLIINEKKGKSTSL